jgi:hypothetical protein
MKKRVRAWVHATTAVLESSAALGAHVSPPGSLMESSFPGCNAGADVFPSRNPSHELDQGSPLPEPNSASGILVPTH